MKLGQLKLFFPIAKVDVEKREVWGRAVQEVADKSREIFDYDTSKPLFQAWSSEFEKATDGKSLGNIRAMHGKVAAGKVIAIDFNDVEKAIDIGAKIVDDAEWAKVIEGVYTGFSIGGSYLKKWKDAIDATLTRYTAAPSETSLVDNPCVPTAMFSMIKADGSTEARPFQHAALLKSALAGELTNGELFELATAYLSADDLGSLAKAEGTMGELRAQLTKLAEDPETEKGDFPGHPFRGNQYAGGEGDTSASVSSEAAHHESENATANSSKASHTTAAAAHTAAAKENRAAGRESTAAHHDKMAAQHTARAARFKKLADDTEIEDDDETESLAKYLAVDSRATITALEKSLGDVTVSLGERTTERDDLTKQLATTAADLAEISKEARALLEVRKGALRVVPKGDDQTELDKTADPKPGDEQAAFKKAFQNPHFVSTVPAPRR